MPQYVIRAIFYADSQEEAERIGIKMVTPPLQASALYWHEVVETNEMLPMDEQAQAILRGDDQGHSVKVPHGDSL